MNTSTPTQPQRFAAAFAGAVFPFAPFAVPAASASRHASTHVPDGHRHPTADPFDVAEFVATPRPRWPTTGRPVPRPTPRPGMGVDDHADKTQENASHRPRRGPPTPVALTLSHTMPTTSVEPPRRGDAAASLFGAPQTSTARLAYRAGGPAPRRRGELQHCPQRTRATMTPNAGGPNVVGFC